MKTSLCKLFAMTIMSAIGLIACTREPEPNDNTSEIYTVSIGWSGEILDVFYEDYVRSNSINDLYAIQIFSKKADSKEWVPYAQGIFDNTENLSVNLLKGYEYKFSATIMVDGANTVWVGDAPFYSSITNAFEYRSDQKYNIWGSYVNFRDNRGLCTRADIERYCGELESYIPEDNNGTVKIKMIRTSFKAKFIAKGKLATEGILEIRIAGAPKIEMDLSQDGKQISKTISFENQRAAWENKQYTETVPVTLNWIRSDGIIMPLGVHDVVYKRNATTVVHVNIENDSEASALGFETDEEESGEYLEDGENDLTITDGEIVNTDIENK